MRKQFKNLLLLGVILLISVVSFSEVNAGQKQTGSYAIEIVDENGDTMQVWRNVCSNCNWLGNLFGCKCEEIILISPVLIPS